jgi:hypothetical protein
MPRDAFDTALRSLALPVAADRWDEVRAAAEAELDRHNVPEADRVTWLEVEVHDWRKSSPSQPLQDVVRASLRAGDVTGLGSRLAQTYFAIHSALRARPFMTHGAVTTLLSQARLMGLLARDEKLSAAQIAKVLEGRDERTEMAWPLVDAVLRPLGFDRGLNAGDVERVLDEDSLLEPAIFADASFAECAEQLRLAAVEVDFPGDMSQLLASLFPLDANGGPTWEQRGAHLCILHFCLTQVAYYDHRLESIYEFSPRGEAARMLADRYRAAGVYSAAENPFLNVAKSAPAIDRAWAWTKKPQEAPSAQALAAVLRGLDSLAWVPRQTLGALLRCWLCRILRVNDATPVLTLPTALSDSEAEKLFLGIATNETNTRGILEQRMVDALTVGLNDDEGLVPHGIGDSVNAPNTMRRKFGDCEFQDTVGHMVRAYEAHAGRLADVYLRAHLQSLENVAPVREARWREAVGAGRWDVEITFIAHDAAGVTIPSPGRVSSTNVSFDVRTFDDLLRDTIAAGVRLGQLATDYLLEPLSHDYTHPSVRQKVLDLLA